MGIVNQVKIFADGADMDGIMKLSKIPSSRASPPIQP